MTSRKREIYQAELLKERAGNEEREVGDRGSPIFFVGVLYAQIPIDLLQDHSVIGNGVRLFASYHNFCKAKKLDRTPFTFVSQQAIARDWMAGCSQPYVCQVTKQLERAGWLTTIRQGLGRSNIIILHSHKGQRISEAQKRRFHEIVKAYFKRINENAENA